MYCKGKWCTAGGKDPLFGRVDGFQIDPNTSSIAARKFFTQYRKRGRGILKGAAFRQRPLSRLLLNVLAGTRTLPPEEPEPKHLWRVGVYTEAFISGR